MDALALFFLVSLTSIATPGPSVIYVTTQGASGGMRAALPATFGVLAADAVYILLSATGLTAVLLASHELFTLVRWVGAAYLIYLGWRLILAGLGAKPAVALASPKDATPRKAFVGGFVLHAANPKALLYFGALVPQFVDPARSLGAQLAVLALIHLLTAWSVMLAYALLSARLRRSGVGVRLRGVLSFSAGSFLAGSGISLIFIRRAAT